MNERLAWLFRLGTMLALLAPGAAWADAPTKSVIIGNGRVALGVGYNGGLNEAGLGLQFTPTSAEGLAQVSACSGWSVVLGQTPTSQVVESFTFTDLGAHSSVFADDATGSRVRVIYDFHAASNAANLYEVSVTVENLGGTRVRPSYTRALTWAAGPPDPSTPLLDPALGAPHPTEDGLGIQFSMACRRLRPGPRRCFGCIWARTVAGRGEREPDAQRSESDLAVAD